MLTFILLAHIWTGAEFETHVIDDNLTGPECIARLVQVEPNFTRATILACEIDRNISEAGQ